MICVIRRCTCIVDVSLMFCTEIYLMLSDLA